MKLIQGAGIALSLTLLGCAGSQASSSTQAFQAVLPTPGIYTGTLQADPSGATTAGQALFLPDGSFSFLADNLAAQVNGSVVEEDYQELLEAGALLTYNGGSTGVPSSSSLFSCSLQVAGTSLSGSYDTAPQPGSRSNGSGTLFLAYDAALNVPFQLEDLEGSYTAPAKGSTAGAFTLLIDEDGDLTDPSGLYAGTLVQAAPGLNAFTVSLTKAGTATTGVACYIPAGTGSGAAPAGLWLQTGLVDAQMELTPVP